MERHQHHRADSSLAAASQRHPYRGINVLLLWGKATEKGYSRNVWMTYKQAEALSAQPPHAFANIQRFRG
jgi:antirestriction protein ArdC